jgi:hypothetical protein
VGDGEVLAGQAVEELAGDRFARGEGDGVDEDVEAVAPVLAEFGEAGVDLGVLGTMLDPYSLAALSTRERSFSVW